ncbi:MAG TPA: hypothetical protein VFQ22_04905 [Longimicrobiales bacterium]|nr:hypothetical protein [Longimicrobiales bacterium]
MRLSELERVLYPGEGIMKGDVLNYYYRIAETIMPHLRDRFALLRCWPEGISGEIHHRRLPEDRPAWVSAVAGGDATFPRPKLVVVDEPAVLAYLTEQTCITPFVSTSTVRAPHAPDRIVFDIDPPLSRPTAFHEVCSAARLVRSVTSGLGLAAFVMSTGSRGLHVHVPIVPGAEFPGVARFARRIAERACRLDPNRVAPSAEARGRDRCVISWERNRAGGVSVAPYALRALPGAPVATPLSWDELRATGPGPSSFDISTVFQRLARRGDPWKDIDRWARPLPDVYAAVPARSLEARTC